MALHEGDVVLLTGVNGFIASHIADIALKAGLKVRGTVRDTKKAQFLVDRFGKQYGPGKFEVVEVKDMIVDGAYDEAAKGCSGIIHTASVTVMSPDPNEVIPKVVDAATGILKTAAKTPSVKRVVYTSSSSAALLPRLNEEFELSNKTWNQEAIDVAWAPPPYNEDRAFTVYAASKTQAEQACWEYVKAENPSFVFNSVLPEYNIGEIYSADQPATTAGSIRELWLNKESNQNFMRLLPAQYFINVDDSARLHVATMIQEDVKGERLMGWGGSFNFNDVIETMQKIDPQRQLPSLMENCPRDLSIIDTGREVEILKRFGRPGWTDLETSIRENVSNL